MNEEKMNSNPENAPTKKGYMKPVVSKIRLVAEEAVLCNCKFNNGVQNVCGSDPSCSNMTRRS